MEVLFTKAIAGLKTVTVKATYIEKAVKALERWLKQDEFKDYVPQIEHLVENGYWDYLLDSFYQTIPFGTGGRRGEVGIGPNRINPWTICASAQGHSQYLVKKHGEAARARGVVLAYDVREFAGNRYLNAQIDSPIKGISSRDLALAAAGVYAANGLKAFIFDGIRTTPELSFAIRQLNAIGGAMFSASHNPPDHNGKKVYDEHGGQLIPPDDELLVNEVTERVVEIKHLSYEDATAAGLITIIGQEVDREYIKIASSLSMSQARDLKIVYTPLHGCGLGSVAEALRTLGFRIEVDPKTSNPSGRFENVTFNIPNPEVVQSFDTTLEYARENGADIILSSDPDADRIGIMAKHQNDWVFLNGNEIASILALYAIEKRGIKDDESVIVKTTVTTNLIKKICEKNGVNLVGELLIGFKYIADAINQLEKRGQADKFLLGCEESHGYLAGSYARDKDAITAAIWLSELAAELKAQGLTLVDYLERIYQQYGYFRNYLTEIRLLGAAGKEKIDLIQASLRNGRPSGFGKFKVIGFEDCLDRVPLVSETDKASKDVLIFNLENGPLTESMKVTVRPSGTEPKIKMYFEIGAKAVPADRLPAIKEEIEKLLREIERAVMLSCYKLIGIDFPERGFLLFWQLPLDDKLKYFEVEPEIEKLRVIESRQEKLDRLAKLLAFLGSDPIEKTDEAFKAKYGTSISDYLGI